MSATRWLLALDASTQRCVIALGRLDGAAPTLVVSDDEDEQPNQASTRLVPRLETVLSRAGIEARDLAVIACGRGPGTFTGTRVAVATAKGLAYGAGCPLLGVSTLASVAASAEHEGTVLAILDARRGEVYGGQWRCQGAQGDRAARVERLDEERVLALPDLLAAISPWPADLKVAGSGVAPYRDALARANLADDALALAGPSVAGLWTAAVAAWVEGLAAHPTALDAVYLRASYAEMGVNPPKRPFVKSPFV